MQEPQVYEYAIVRVVPRVEREEFINVGVILYCRGQRFLGFDYYIDEARLISLYHELDVAEVREHLQAFALISQGDASGGPIAKLDAASRFRWLTATRSTIVQASKVHPGLCTCNADDTLKKIFNKLVL